MSVDLLPFDTSLAAIGVDLALERPRLLSEGFVHQLKDVVDVGSLRFFDQSLGFLPYVAVRPVVPVGKLVDSTAHDRADLLRAHVPTSGIQECRP